MLASSLSFCCGTSYVSTFGLDDKEKKHIGDIFSYFSQKTVYDISCKLPPSIGDNLYEMLKPLFRDKLEKIFRYGLC